MSLLPMPPMSHSKIMLLGLWKCEVDDSNPYDCILHNNRLKLGFPERGDYHDWYLWVKALTDEEAEKIYTQHMVCYSCKKSLLDELNKVGNNPER